MQQPKPKAPPGHRNSQLPSALPLPEDAGHHFFIRCATATHATRPYLTDIHDSTLAFRSNSHCQASGGDQESGSCERSCPDRHDFSDLHGSLCALGNPNHQANAIYLELSLMGFSAWYDNR